MISDWGPIIVLPAVTLLARHLMPSWLFMWTLALAVFCGCKWLTWRRARRHWVSASFGSTGYLWGWVGMDAESFLNGVRPETSPSFHEWLAAAGKTLVGAAVVTISARLALTHESLAVGWIGMAGMILVLHFGSFHLLALLWRRNNVDVQPLMGEPLRASSLAEFWGRRWNAAFNALARDVIFWPLARRLGAKPAAIAVFLASGLVHDMVISLPAGGGYGLPTAYFLLQGVATIFERSRVGRAIGLGRSWRGRTFTLAIAGAPAFWLFHPPFVRNVILPMLVSIARLTGI